MSAPCGGERPSGSSRYTGSRGPERSPAKQDGSRALVEAAGLRRLVDLDDRPLDGADPRDEHAAIELGEPETPPRPAAERDRHGHRADAELRVAEDERERASAARRTSATRKHRHARGVRERAPDADGAHDDVR